MQPRTALVICPHADDAAVFCGGTVAKLASQGWRVAIVRVTDDCKDSLGLSRAETIRRNASELRDAARILGAAEVIELGFETDCLADLPLTVLRERFVYLLRRHRPYLVMGFDPFGLYEPNMDHIRSAQAMEEALWVACFDKHHPEHLAQGLEPFGPAERWYYARRLPEVTHYEDVTDFMAARLEALAAHKTMAMNLLNQLKLPIEAAGRTSAMVRTAMETGDPREVYRILFEADARAAAKAAGLPEGRLAEPWRRVGLDDLEPLMDPHQPSSF